MTTRRNLWGIDEAHRRRVEEYGTGVFAGCRRPGISITHAATALLDEREPGGGSHARCAPKRRRDRQRHQIPAKLLLHVLLLVEVDAANYQAPS